MRSMGFCSILGRKEFPDFESEKIVMPNFFYDLNLDQVVEEILDKQRLYDLRKYYFFKPEAEDIPYRIDVLKDMEASKSLFQKIVDFSLAMRKVRKHLDNMKDSDLEIQRQKWNLDAAYYYVNVVKKLYSDLEEENLGSEGFQGFFEWLKIYTTSEPFLRLCNDTERQMQLFHEMKFNIHIMRDRVIIKPGYLEEDYCKQVLDTFEEESEVDHIYQKNPFGSFALSSLEIAVLELLQKPYAHVFDELAVFHSTHQDYISDVLTRFEEESQFYIAFCLYKNEMQEMNFHFCYPEVQAGEDFYIRSCYDLALAKKNSLRKKEVIFNDGIYRPGEKFFVVTGPNQGGKTTFARALGQSVYLAFMGLMVPCKQARLPVFDGIYTHFASEESMETGAGKLKEELTRLNHMMNTVTNHSFVIINEIFTSATSYDAYIMGKKTINYFMDKDCLGVYVTHIYELTKDDHRIVSLVAALLSEHSNIRTFRIERRPADGKSYANSIVEKYHMTYEDIKERIKR